MNLNDYFDPIEIAGTTNYIEPKHQLLSNITLHQKESKIQNIESFKLAIIGVPDFFENPADVNSFALEKIRSHLYSLSAFNKPAGIIDLGNLKPGKTINDQKIALRDVVTELLTLGIIPIILGKADNILYTTYSGFGLLNQTINIVHLDSKINIYENRENNYKSDLWKIIVEENESLFSFTNIGYQTHFVSNNITNYLSEQLHFFYRLGYIRSHLKETEPIFRDADFIAFSISAVRQSDAFGQTNPSPNGLFGEDICQMAYFAGISNKIKVFSVLDYNITQDINLQTAHLAAQIIWYFIEGVLSRIKEYPFENDTYFTKYVVNLDNFKNELVFYKSEKTNRWWIEVPSLNLNKHKNTLISCTYQDYQQTGNGDIPERWLKAYQKINS